MLQSCLGIAATSGSAPFSDSALTASSVDPGAAMSASAKKHSTGHRLHGICKEHRASSLALLRARTKPAGGRKVDAPAVVKPFPNGASAGRRRPYTQMTRTNPRGRTCGSYHEQHAQHRDQQARRHPPLAPGPAPAPARARTGRTPAPPTVAPSSPEARRATEGGGVEWRGMESGGVAGDGAGDGGRREGGGASAVGARARR